MNEQKKMWMGVAGFVACLTLLGGFLLATDQEGLASAQSKEQLVSVVEGTEVDLAFKVGGSIAEVKVKEGDVVQKGQLIALLSNQELLAKREQAEAAYKLAQAKLGQAKKGVTVTKTTSSAQVQQAKAAVDAAVAQYNAGKNGARPEEIEQLKTKLEAAMKAKQTAEANVKRMQELYQEGAIPQAKLEEAEAQQAKAQAEYTAAEEQLKMAKSGASQEQLDALQAQVDQANAAYRQALAGRGQVDIKEYDVSSAQAGVEQAKGALDEINAYLANTRLVSPVNGIVKSVSVQQGELVAQGFTVVTIQAQDDRYVKFYVDEDTLGKLKAGDPIALTVPAQNREVAGRVETIAPAADFAVKKATQELGERDIRAFQVKVSLDDKDVLPGFSVEWHLQGAE